jgi:hypothetical protein
MAALAAVNPQIAEFVQEYEQSAKASKHGFNVAWRNCEQT